MKTVYDMKTVCVRVRVATLMWNIAIERQWQPKTTKTDAIKSTVPTVCNNWTLSGLAAVLRSSHKFTKAVFYCTWLSSFILCDQPSLYLCRSTNKASPFRARSCSAIAIFTLRLLPKANNGKGFIGHLQSRGFFAHRLR